MFLVPGLRFPLFPLQPPAPGQVEQGGNEEDIQDQGHIRQQGMGPDGKREYRALVIPEGAVVGGGYQQPVFPRREPVQRDKILVPQPLPMVIQPLQPVRITDFFGRTVAEGGKTDADVPLPPGEGDVLLPLCQEDVLGPVLAAD